MFAFVLPDSILDYAIFVPCCVACVKVISCKFVGGCAEWTGVGTAVPYGMCECADGTVSSLSLVGSAV